MLGEGIRFFDNLEHAPLMFEDPTVVEGNSVFCTCAIVCASRRRAHAFADPLDESERGLRDFLASRGRS